MGIGGVSERHCTAIVLALLFTAGLAAAIPAGISWNAAGRALTPTGTLTAGKATITFAPGWNLFSLPAEPTGTLTPNSLFAAGNCTSQPASTIWAFNTTAYVQVTPNTPLQTAAGYWAYAQKGCTATYAGTNTTLSKLNYQLKNATVYVIGSLSQTTNIYSILGSCTGTTNSGVKTMHGPIAWDAYGQAYANSTTLQPGAAYFIKANANCALTWAACARMPPAVQASPYYANAYPGGNATYAVTVTNNDRACPSENITLTGSATIGTTSQTTRLTLPLESNSQTTVNISFTAPANLAPGYTYPVTFAIAGLGGTASTSAMYTVEPLPCTYTQPILSITPPQPPEAKRLPSRHCAHAQRQQ